MPQTTIVLAHPIDFARWRAATRDLVTRRVPPDEIAWHVTPGDTPDATAPSPTGQPFRIPRETMQLAADVVQSMLPDRFTLAYGLIYAHVTGTDIAPSDLARMAGAAETVRAETVHLRHDLFTLMQRSEGEDIWHGTLDAATHAPESNARFMTFQLSLAPWRLSLPGRRMEWTGRELLHGRDDAAAAPLRSTACRRPPCRWSPTSTFPASPPCPPWRWRQERAGSAPWPAAPPRRCLAKAGAMRA